MHRTTYTIRRISDEQLPMIPTMDGTPSHRADVGELAHMGIHHLHDDIYSVVQIDNRVIDRTTGEIAWVPRVEDLPGDVLTEGLVGDRFAALPADVKSHVMRVRVLRSTENDSLRARAHGNIVEAKTIFAERVGSIGDATMAAPAAVVSKDADVTEADVQTEARRLRGVFRANPHTETFEPIAVEHVVPLASVTADDVIEDATHIVPHTWAGEARR